MKINIGDVVRYNDRLKGLLRLLEVKEIRCVVYSHLEGDVGNLIYMLHDGDVRNRIIEAFEDEIIKVYKEVKEDE